jgi:hypothetical protein
LYSEDTFIVLTRTRGWWVVQRDPTGLGILDTDIDKQRWVPAGCLLETNVPVASAIATAANSGSSGSSSGDSPPEKPVSKMPILPSSIISTSFPGIGLMGYKKKEEEELDLVKDDASIATAANSGSSGSLSGDSPPEMPVSKRPILPLSIICKSFLGIVLMDYEKKGEEELDLVKDDALRVFKRYNHWSYVSLSSFH